MKLRDRQIKKYFVGLALTGLFFLFLAVCPARAQEQNYPRLANFYLKTPIWSDEAKELARFDVLILHMLAQQNSAEQIKKIRQINPDIKILVYIVAQEFPTEMHRVWDTTSNGLFKQQLAGITEEMYLKDQNNSYVIFWGTNRMLNATDYPTGSNYRWTDYLSDFVVNKLLSTGLWDGVFYDNSWYDVSWVNGGAIDADKDGRNDEKTRLDTAWRAGMTKLFRQTKEKAGKPILIVGNGDKGYYGDINGIYFENFTTSPYISWEEKMKLYRSSVQTSQKPSIAIVGNTSQSANTAQKDYRQMRFGLTSALMENGYYAYDAGSNHHSENWWYDEYSVNLGEPMTDAISQTGANDYIKDVWRREFTNGLAVVNSLAESREVDLGGEYEKIIGTQDLSVNNGGIVSKVKIAAKDGLLMLKTYESLKNVLFINGAFVQFMDMLGNRVRNGFFAYDERYPGGSRIIFTDLDGQSGDETVVATGAKLEILDNKGERWYSEYPYDGKFDGAINISTNKLFENQSQNQIVVTPSYGGKIIMYNYHGALMQAGYSPFDPKGYFGGLSVAAARLNGPGQPGNVVIGTGIGKTNEVLIYDNRVSKLLKRFNPYDKKYRGGIYVAAGDLTGDGKDEIIVSAMTGKNMPIKVFDAQGKKLSEFMAGGIFGGSNVMVQSVDINFDGKKDIVIISL
jgi:hypothetical protein